MEIPGQLINALFAFAHNDLALDWIDWALFSAVNGEWGMGRGPTKRGLLYFTFSGCIVKKTGIQEMWYGTDRLNSKGSEQ